MGIDLALTDQAGSLRHLGRCLIEVSSTDREILTGAEDLLPSGGGMVVLDPDHSRGYVLAELDIWNPPGAVGSWLVVEEININGHPVLPLQETGPLEVVKLFLRGRDEFVVDDEIWRRNKFSFHQRGWLRWVRE